MGKKKKRQQKQVEERNQKIAPSLLVLYALLGLIGFAVHITEQVKDFSVMYWTGLAIVVAAMGTFWVFFNRLLRLDEEQEKHLK